MRRRDRHNIYKRARAGLENAEFLCIALGRESPKGDCDIDYLFDNFPEFKKCRPKKSINGKKLDNGRLWLNNNHRGLLARQIIMDLCVITTKRGKKWKI